MQITVLGSPELLRGGAPVAGLVYSRSAALVYYLAATGRAHSREALAGLFWPDSADEQARKNLRDLLADLRRAIGPYLAISRQSVGLDGAAPIDCDLWRFEAALGAARGAPGPAEEAAALRAAVAAYGGDLLEGLYVAQADGFEEWMLAERERLRHLAIFALYSLAGHAAAQGAYLEGVSHATRLLTLDPLREESHRQLMRLLALSGQRGAALAQYETLRRTLAAELGAEPGAESEELRAQILAGALAASPQPGLPAAPHEVAPAPAPVAPIPHTPPASLVAFVGREAETAELGRRLRAPACRLLTIVGPGGMGKTALALHLAHGLATAEAPAFAHGVAFVPLGALAPADGDEAGGAVALSIAEALGLSLEGPRRPFDQLADYLRPRSLLLVLDNFEQLLAAAPALVELLQRAPAVKALVTSRVRLGVRGEQTLALDGLPAPADDPALDDDALDSYAALRLFRQAAEAVQPELPWSVATARAAAQICRLVDGLPLGIELAAGLTRIVPPAELARELAGGLGVLEDTRRDTPARHRSLQAVFEHSWRLLAPDERRLLRQLIVFRGGFSLTAVEAVAAASAKGDTQAVAARRRLIGALGSLVDASLVRRHGPQVGEEPRFELLEVVRQCTAEQPAEPAELALAQARHSAYYLGLVAQRGAALLATEQSAALHALGAESENIRAAWRHACERGELSSLDGAVTGLFHLYEMRSWFQEGATAFATAASAAAVARTAEAERVHGRLLARQGWFTFLLGRRGEAEALLRASLERLRPLGQDAELVFPLNYLAAVTYHAGAYEPAVATCEAALALSLRFADRAGESVARTILGQIATIVGDYEAARRHCVESLRVERELGNRWGMAYSLIALGEVALAVGDYGEARRQFEAGLAIRRGLGDRRGAAICLAHLATMAAAQGELAEADRLFEASLGLFHELGSLTGAAQVLSQWGFAAMAAGDEEAARRHFRAALATLRGADAAPQLLAAVVGLAELRAATDPAGALTLASFVAAHPAAARASKARASALRERHGPAAPTAVRHEHDPAELAGLVERLLAAS